MLENIFHEIPLIAIKFPLTLNCLLGNIYIYIYILYLLSK